MNEPVAFCFESAAPGVWRWEVYSPHHKVALTSHAVGVGSTLYVFDPVPLPDSGLNDLIRGFSEVLIVLTNENHERDSASWSRAAKAPIFAPQGAAFDLINPERLPAGATPWRDWLLHPLPGGPAGETAFLRGDLVVFGDAVVNLSGRTLELLPAKYCRDHTSLREQVGGLCVAGFQTALMSHGAPIMRNAAARIGLL